MLETTKHKLDNGLTILLTHYPASNISAVEVLVNFGPIDENEKNMGAAHFIEHMLFKGTKGRKAADINRYIDDVGGTINAATLKDTTVYYTELPQKHMERGIELLSDILLNSTFPEDELERERLVIQEEIKMIEDTPHKAIWNDIFSVAFKGSSVGMNIAGTVETVRAMKREELARLYELNYSPERMVLSIVADLQKTDKQRIIALAKEKFNSGKKSGSVKREMIADKAMETRVSEEKREINQAHQIIAIIFPPVNAHDWIIGRAIQKYLTGGMSSVLLSEIREKRGLAYAVYSDYNASKTFGLYAVYAGMAEENREQVEKIILDEFRKLKAEKISQEDLARLKGYMEGEFLTEIDNKLTLAGTLAQYEIYGSYKTAGEYLGAIQTITPERMQEFAKKYLDTETYFKALIRPEKSQS